MLDLVWIQISAQPPKAHWGEPGVSLGTVAVSQLDIPARVALKLKWEQPLIEYTVLWRKTRI